MPSFHTKTIESILEPVAQQVSKLIVLHDEASDGSPMPSLHSHVREVKAAVQNLVNVGLETTGLSEDPVLRQDMPGCLRRVEDSANSLQHAADLLSSDPYSQPGRKKLIEGSRGILQGTGTLLCIFDLSEVRKIITHCRTVLDVLSVIEVVDTMEHLVEFVKNLSPCLSRMTKEVDHRLQDLTHLANRDTLNRGLDKIKNLTPILISAIKMFIITEDQGGLGSQESKANRDYIGIQMTDTIQNMIRVLTLTSDCEADQQDCDDLVKMRALRTSMESRSDLAMDWLGNQEGLLGSAGERALRQILQEASALSEFCPQSMDRQNIQRQASELESLIDALAEYRFKHEGNSPPSISLERSCRFKIGELLHLCSAAVSKAERNGLLLRPARTLRGKLSQAQRWLADPRGGERRLGVAACHALTKEGRRLVDEGGFTGDQTLMADWFLDRGVALAGSCREVDNLTDHLELITDDKETINASEIYRISMDLCRSLVTLYERLYQGLIYRSAEKLVDIYSPLDALCQAAATPFHKMTRVLEYEVASEKFHAHAYQLCLTVELAAIGSSDSRRADNLRVNASEIFGLSSQVQHAARLLLDLGPVDCGGGAAVSEHLQLMRQAWAESVEKMRSGVDEVTDTAAFIQVQEAGILKDTERTEQSIKQASSRGVVEHTSCIARRANRVIQVARLEADNSEDGRYVDQVNVAVKQLRATVTPMVQDAKGLVSNIRDRLAIEKWRASNSVLIRAVSGVRLAIGPSPRSAIIPSTTSALVLSPSNPRPLPPAASVTSPPVQRAVKPLRFRFPSGGAAGPSSSSVRFTPQGQHKGDGAGTIRPSVAAQHGYSGGGMISPELVQELSQLLMNDPYHRKLAPLKFEDAPPSALWQDGYDRGVVTPPSKRRIENPISPHVSRSTKQAAAPSPVVPHRTIIHVNNNSNSKPHNNVASSEHTPTDQDFDDDFNFPSSMEDQPIMAAAQALHQQTQQWSSKDNPLIAAARRMAALMAKLSQIVRGEWGTKKDLIDVARAIADASEGVTQCAKKLSKDCTDKRMKTNLLQACERIPTMATQLYILSTVKATMLQPQETDEEIAATDMLVGNAQNLMQSVVDTVQSAEASTIKIRIDSGSKLTWSRRTPWFQS